MVLFRRNLSDAIWKVSFWRITHFEAEISRNRTHTKRVLRFHWQRTGEIFEIRKPCEFSLESQKALEDFLHKFKSEKRTQEQVICYFLPLPSNDVRSREPLSWPKVEVLP